MKPLTNHLHSLDIRVVEPVHRSEIPDLLRGGDLPSVRYEPNLAECEDEFDAAGIVGGAATVVSACVVGVMVVCLVALFVWAVWA